MCVCAFSTKYCSLWHFRHDLCASLHSISDGTMAAYGRKRCELAGGWKPSQQHEHCECCLKFLQCIPSSTLPCMSRCSEVSRESEDHCSNACGTGIVKPLETLFSTASQIQHHGGSRIHLEPLTVSGSLSLTLATEHQGTKAPRCLSHATGMNAEQALVRIRCVPTSAILRR